MSGKVTSRTNRRENTMPTKARSQRQVRGRWEENRMPWYAQSAIYCNACGMLIPKKQFVVEAGGVRRRFCGADCAQLGEKLRRLDGRKSAS